MDNTLYHHGVKGMRWGIRRDRKQSAYHEDYRKAHNKKSFKSMSDQELRSVNNRLQMESQYKHLTKKAGIGKKVVKAFVAGATTISSVALAANTYKKYGTAAIDKIGDVILKKVDFNIKI